MQRALDQRTLLGENADTSWNKYLDIRTFGALDGIRAICILAVIWHHVPRWTGEPQVLTKGFLGVDMFFVLSGFLIVTLLLREKDRHSEISLRKFYARRTLRIFPIYYMILFGTLLAYLIFKPHSETAHRFYNDFPYLASYLSNWINVTANNQSITWSLSTEEQFYLVWPMVEKLLPARLVLGILIAFIGVNQLVNFGIFAPQIQALYGGSGVEVPHIWQTTFTPIALGVLLAHLLHDRRSFALLYEVLGKRWSSLGLTVSLLVIILLSPPDIAGFPRLLIQFTMMLTLGSLVVREDQVGAGALRIPLLRYVGMISYGIYLYHMYVMHIVNSTFSRLHITATTTSPVGYSLLAFVATAIGAVLVAGLSFRFFEQPILRLKSHFSV